MTVEGNVLIWLGWAMIVVGAIMLAITLIRK